MNNSGEIFKSLKKEAIICSPISFGVSDIDKGMFKFTNSMIVLITPSIRLTDTFPPVGERESYLSTFGRETESEGLEDFN